ncbi:MAG: HAD-IA family hydrolase [Dehalococcoidia bacterium]
MTRPYDIITFDCYGTLIDWDKGIVGAFLQSAAADGVTLDRNAVLHVYEEIERSAEAQPFQSYRSILTETAKRVAARLNWALPEYRAAFLAESLPDWQPFADTNPALERLAAAGYQLGILSNVDDDLLAGTRRHLHATFDLLITAQQVGSYKPAPGHFQAARRQIGDRRWLHAAQSYFHDIVPAQSLGIETAWINRDGEAPSGTARPEHEFPTVEALAQWLVPLT